MNALKHKRIWALTLGSVIALAALLGVSKTLASSQPVVPSVEVFSSLDQAQARVPFKLRSLASSPPTFKLVGITVKRMIGGMILVELVYQSPDGALLTLDQSNAQFQPPDGVTVPVTVNGASGLAISTQNIEGVPIGAVYWTTPDATVMLIGGHVTGPGLVPLAATAQ